jgi:hypothetical protein
MFEKDVPQMVEHQEPPSDSELQAVKTNNTVSASFDETEDPDSKFHFIKAVIFLVRISFLPVRTVVIIYITQIC